MSFLSLLNKYSEATETVYLKLLLNYKFDEKTYHFLFEGQDDQFFYINYINSIFSSSPEPFYYICNGKKNLYKCYNDINWTKYSNRRVLFFTDKDLDDIIQKSYPTSDNIFVTKYYSFENYLVCSDILKRFLRETCHLRDEILIQSIVDVFEEQLKIYNKLVLPISAWLVDNRKSTKPANLANIDLSKIFAINSNLHIIRKKSLKSTIDYVERVTNNVGTPSDRSDLLKISKELVKIPEHKIYLRGKFELWFLYTFFKKVIEIVITGLNEEISQNNKRLASGEKKQPKYVVNVELKESNIVELFATRLKIPVDVKSFLTSNVRRTNRKRQVEA
ncbi:DUF4435 domain-containing protein [Pontibacter sp. CAU 1760]